MNISIRAGKRTDANTIAAYQVAMAQETENFKLDLSTVERGALAVFDDPAKGQYWIAEANGEVVGCLLCIPEWSDWRAKTVLWIHSVYVIPEARGSGVYKALYMHVKSLMEKSQDYCGIRLYVDKSNHAAQAVYNKLGMNGEHYTLFEAMK